MCQNSVPPVKTEHGSGGTAGKAKILYTEARLVQESKPQIQILTYCMEGITQNKTAGDWNPAEVRMSFFRKPITNKVPESKPVSLFWVYQYVRGRWAMPETEQLRIIADKDEARKFKGSNFDYITPSGLFSYCSDQCLMKHSGLITMDLDELNERTEEMFEKLIDDPAFDTLLLFRSPRGNGLKWFIHIDLSRCDHRTWFTAVRNYLMATYQLTEKQVDAQCINVSRACFLCHDENAYLKTELIEYF